MGADGQTSPPPIPAAGGPSRLFVLRPVATSLLMCALALSGLVGYRLLPQAALPEVDYPTIQVTTLYPGASPTVMTSSVTAPLERQFGQMPGLAQMFSRSSADASVVVLRFDLTLPLDVAEQEVQAAINAASGFLPTDLPNPPTYAKINPADAPVLTLGLTSSVIPLTSLEDTVETELVQKLSQVPGVGLVTVSGGERPAVRVDVNPDALAAAGLTLASVQSAISASNVNLPKGSFDGPHRAFTITANDQLTSADEYRALVLAVHNGSPIRLGQVATVTAGPENSHLAAWVDRRPGIIVNVQRQPGANVIAVVDRIRAILPSLVARLPASVRAQVLSDRTVTIRAAIADVRLELVFSVLLVVGVIFLFLHSPWATLIPALAAPLSLVGSFGFMYVSGFSINNLTLMALTIATGFVVDDAIVMIENIMRHREAGEGPLEAALRGAGQIGFTIISLTVSLIAVLIPLLFMGDVVGRLFHEFAITLAIAILLSAVVSLTFTPMLCARLLTGDMPRAISSPPAGRIAGWLSDLHNLYGRALRAVVARSRLVLLVFAGTVIATGVLYELIPKGFFPVEDTGLVSAVTIARQNASHDAMWRAQARVTDAFVSDPAVAGVASFIGSDGETAGPNQGRSLVSLAPLSQRGVRVGRVISGLARTLDGVAGVRVLLSPVQDLTINDLVTPEPDQLSVSAPVDRVVRTVTKDLVAQLAKEPAISDVTSDLDDNGLTATVDIDRGTAARFGITAAAVDAALENSFGQRLVSTIFTQSNQYRVVLQAEPQDRAGLDGFNHVYIASSTGTPVLLSAIAHVSQGRGALAIDHLGQSPAALISFAPARGYSIGQAVSQATMAMRAAHVPVSATVAFQGEAAVFSGSGARERELLIAAVITIYIVLGVLYESYIHPLTILSTLPSAGLGALIALWLTGHSLSLVALLGVILLIGIVQKNGIMMVDFALDAERNEGLTPEQAILRAAESRLRPILMTTFAALFGAIPLAFGGGMGAELRTPLGIALIGGLLSSQALTLFTTPVIYLFFDRLARRLGRSASRATHHPT